MKYLQELFVQIFWAPMFIIMAIGDTYGESNSVLFTMSATISILLSVVTGLALGSTTQMHLFTVFVISFGVYYVIGIIVRLLFVNEHGGLFKID